MDKKILPSRKELQSLEVNDLKDDAELLYALLLSVTQTILKNKFNQKEFSEFKEKDDSGMRLGREVVLTGSVAAANQIAQDYLYTKQGADLLYKKYAGEIVGETFIKELTINSKRTLRRFYERSKTRQVSDNVFRRLNNQVISDGSFVFDQNSNEISLADNVCNDAETFSSSVEALDSITLAFETNMAISTQELKKALIRVLCSNKGSINRNDFVELLNNKIGAWVVNNAYDLDSIIKASDSDSQDELGETSFEMKKIQDDLSMSIASEKIYDIVTSDSELNEFLKNLDDREFKLLYILINNEKFNTAEEKLKFTNLKKSTYYDAENSFKDKLYEVLGSEDDEMQQKIGTLAFIVDKLYKY